MIVNVRKEYADLLLNSNGEIRHTDLVSMDLEVEGIRSNKDLKQLINELQKLYDESIFYGDIDD